MGGILRGEKRGVGLDPVEASAARALVHGREQAKGARGMAAGAYSIEVRPSAKQALGKLDPALQREVGALIDGLADDPRPTGAKPLKGKLRGMHRVKFGPRSSHRLLYVVEDQAKRVTIAAVGKRGDVYKQRRTARLKGRGK